jgi:hypothetical protein
MVLLRHTLALPPVCGCPLTLLSQGQGLFLRDRRVTFVPTIMYRRSRKLVKLDRRANVGTIMPWPADHANRRGRAGPRSFAFV